MLKGQKNSSFQGIKPPPLMTELTLLAKRLRAVGRGHVKTRLGFSRKLRKLVRVGAQLGV